MERKVLTPEQLANAIKNLDGWLVDGSVLKKSMKFENFAEALAQINQIGELAEAADHHPDITFGWGYSDIALTTHDRGGITDVDIALAKEIDRL